MKSSGAKADLIDSARSRIDDGDLFGAFSLLCESSDELWGSPDVRYLEVLVLARMGDTAEALRRYKEFSLDRVGSVEALALRPRLLKDEGYSQTGEERSRLLGEAAEEYRILHGTKGGYYPLINAATLAMLSGEPATARRRAEAVLQDPQVVCGADYWTRYPSRGTNAARPRR